METREKNLYKLEKICVTTVWKLYPCSIQPVVFSQVQHCERNHTLGMEANLGN